MKFKDYKYQRPDLATERAKLEEIAEKLATETNVDVAKSLIDEANKIKSSFETMATIVSIRNSIDTNDEYYEKEQEWFDENSPLFTESATKFSKALVESPIRSKLEEIYGTQWFKLQEMNLKAFDSCIIEDMIEESKLTTEYEKLLASAKIEFDGKINNLSQMSPYQNSPDREIRKAATLKVVEFMEGIEPQVDEIYDKMVKVRTKMAQKMGYKTYTDFGYLRMSRSDYNQYDVAGYRNQVLDAIVPVAKEIIEEQKKRIGIPDMKSYDQVMFYNDGNPKPRGNKDELVQKALAMYSDMSAETKEFFTYMVENDLLDLETKPGKRGGGYCTFINDYASPFIFSNFNGTSGDVDVLTHEAGHAFEVYSASRRINVSDLFWPTMEACEIHSMSMEFFAHPYMESFFEEDTEKYRYMHLAESILFIPYGVTVDDFQHYVYENPEATPAMRKEYWSKIEKKYTPWKDYDGIEYYERGSYWQRQHHIFSFPFYYIDYTLAQVCAFQYYLYNIADHKKAWANYVSLCQLGGSKSFTALLDSVGLKNPFIDGTLKDIMDKLKVALKALEEAYNKTK